MVLCRSPTLWGVESAKGRTVKMRRWRTERQERNRGTDRDWRGQCVGRGRGESGAGAVWLLARGVDVQLALENVVDDWLGQVVHDVAVPMLQGQPG